MEMWIPLRYYPHFHNPYYYGDDDFRNGLEGSEKVRIGPGGS